MSKANPKLIYYYEGHVSYLRYPEAARIAKALELYVTEGRTFEILEYGVISDPSLTDRLVYWEGQRATLENNT